MARVHTSPEASNSQDAMACVFASKEIVEKIQQADIKESELTENRSILFDI